MNTVNTRLAGYSQVAPVEEDTGSTTPFLHSYYAKSDSKTAQLVRSKAPSVKSGEPVVIHGETVHVIRDADDDNPSRFALLGPFVRYYAKRKESDLSLIAAQSKCIRGGKKKGDTGWREEAMAVVALLGHGEAPIPFLAIVEKHRVRFLVAANNAVAEGSKKDPRMTTHEIELNPATAQGSGFSYIAWDASSYETEPADLKALVEGIDPELLDEVLDRYDAEFEKLNL